MNIVVVESPAKAKTINKYLGEDYLVLASYGHVRDLPAKDGSVRPNEDFAMSWEVSPKAEKHLKEIAKAVRGSGALILATDPDREGEAISWHITEELRRRRALKDVDVKRVVFNEVTKAAVVDAFHHPRELNQELIEAYLARRALDYLVGFCLSPVLWRKLPGSRSAGRVQSVALKLICEREAEIEVFRAREYWTVDVGLLNQAKAGFSARLTHLDGHKLDKFDLGDDAKARAVAARLEAAKDFAVESVEKKQTQRHPPPPFTTSSLQQEASRKLGFGATRTMRLAQRLYEGVELSGETVGLITYMRTDGVQISTEAIASARKAISDHYGGHYLPDKPRIYKTKAKNAQEAHEAIRPTDPTRRPEAMRAFLEADALKLYELIWKRTIASQMASARLDQVAVDITAEAFARLRANGSVVVFDGFLALYQEGRDEPNGAGGEQPSEQERRLPPLAEGEALERTGVVPEQHFTQPPPRYSEASLVKQLEVLGIGRPSTYASILQVLQDRHYVRLEKRRFVPEDRGRLVTAFLSNFFDRYVQYNFTAELENELDEISGGRIDWKVVLRRFWEAFEPAIESTGGLRIAQVIDTLDETLGQHFFPLDPERPDYDPRRCKACADGRLGLRLGRSGGFIGCSNYPECRYTRPLAVPGNGEDQAESEEQWPRKLGDHPETNELITLRKGPYGIYVQQGEAADGNKPKRVSLPKNLSPAEVDLARALSLLSLPRVIGEHEGEEISAGIGRYGPYVKRGRTYRSIGNDEDVLTIGLNRAVALLAEAGNRRQAPAGDPVGEHPADKAPITLHKGRYGPYLRHKKLIASLPKSVSPEEVTLEIAVELLAAQAEKAKAKAKGGSKAKASGRAKGTAKAKSSTTAKKSPATRKAASNKSGAAKSSK